MWVYFFAYGHNMNEANLHRLGIIPQERRGAVLRDFRLVFNKLGARPGEGYANIAPEPGARVEGVLYTLRAEDLERLDLAVGAPHAYERHRVTVETAEGEAVSAYAYRANPAMVRPGLKPSLAYLMELLSARAFLSSAYVQELENAETLEGLSRA
ncbi:MAG: gamma-glutamylcyclotransferase [Bacteroidetes bacterium]|nr:gamma-glutamylcyclotransferase [Rhodothermia bacterium]MCS7155153.1 gamma-glutamylcyclotransferase [Bacteroidota bacterium]MCX7906220.1 gamma-glutamylcyclotransferase [Bacteroidota bacterium]MDW8138347.1 gamma-glutamylcyclotransferase family protein [Bacteroidota bacterium]MDW8286032.1 gamma-glutamylcyclotransferase family protein [Bacteroidota bacterium]